jgi:hypothetical protein
MWIVKAQIGVRHKVIVSIYHCVYLSLCSFIIEAIDASLLQTSAQINAAYSYLFKGYAHLKAICFWSQQTRPVSPFTLMNVQWLLVSVNVSVRDKQGVASSKYIRVKGCT